MSNSSGPQETDPASGFGKSSCASEAQRRQCIRTKSDVRLLDAALLSCRRFHQLHTTSAQVKPAGVVPPRDLRRCAAEPYLRDQGAAPGLRGSGRRIHRQSLGWPRGQAVEADRTGALIEGWRGGLRGLGIAVEPCSPPAVPAKPTVNRSVMNGAARPLTRLVAACDQEGRST